MKKLNTAFNGSLNYLAGVSSPSAANLTVQGLTAPTRSPKKTTRSHSFRSPFAYLAGVSSPSAGNVSVQGLTTKAGRVYAAPSEHKQGSGIGNAIFDVLSTPTHLGFDHYGPNPSTYSNIKY